MRRWGLKTGVGGFTLIELLVVIVILAILMGIAIPAYLAQQKKARDSAAKQYLATSLRSARGELVGNGGSAGYPVAATLSGLLGADQPQITYKVGDQTMATTSGTIVIDSTTGGQTLILYSKSGSGDIWKLTASPTSTSDSSSFSDLGSTLGSSATALTLGGASTCALYSGGTAKCIGNNTWGELGNGTTTPSTSSAVTVSGLSNATQIEAGNQNYCALISGGTVKCWGYDQYGQDGDGTSGSGNNQSTPVSVSGLSNAASLVPSEGEAMCAITSGAANLYCWGRNNWGNFGNGSTTDSSTPIEVKGVGGSGFLSGVTGVSTAYGAICAIVSGNVDCWGYNNGGTTTLPTAVAGLSSVTQIVGGNTFNCALISGGTVKCWGMGTEGQLGNGSNTSWQSSPVSVSGITNATALAASDYAVCALLSDGTVKCWGDNGWGELGNNSLGTNSNVPVSVSGLSGATALMHGEAAISFCALTSGNVYKCWGGGSSGQLANGSTSDQPAPIIESLL